MNPDQTDPKSQSYLGLLQYLKPKNIIRRKRTRQKCLTGGKRGKFVYLACPTNPLKGPELSTLTFARTLVFGVPRPGIAHFILNVLISCMYRTNGADA